MNVDEAWESFIKSHQIKKASIDEKLDVIASQMNELQTDVSRLTESIPEMQGDDAAMETANAMAEPGADAAPGPEELGAMMGGEEEPSPEGEAPVEGAPAEGAPEAGGEPPMVGEGGSVAPEDEISDEELDALLGGEDMGAPEMGGGGNDMIAKIKDLIMNEDDPGKLATLSELLTMAASSDGADSMEGMEDVGAPMEDVAPLAEEPNAADEEVGPIGKSESFEKADDIAVDTPAEAKEETESAVDKPLDDGPEPMTEESVAKACPFEELMSRITEAIVPIVKEFVGEPVAPVEGDLDSAAEPEIDVEVEADAEPIVDEESDEEDEEDEEDEKEDSKDDEDKKEPEDDISEETDHFEESECESEPVMKSFQELFSKRLESRVGVDGMYAKVPPHMRSPELKDGFREEMYAPIYKSADEDMGGRHIMTLEEMASIQKSTRPDATTSVNGEMERPDPTTIRKSGSAFVPFEELMNASDRHEAMQKEWDEYNLFKSRY